MNKIFNLVTQAALFIPKQISRSLQWSPLAPK